MGEMPSGLANSSSISKTIRVSKDRQLVGEFIIQNNNFDNQMRSTSFEHTDYIKDYFTVQPSVHHLELGVFSKTMDNGRSDKMVHLHEEVSHNL